MMFPKSSFQVDDALSYFPRSSITVVDKNQIIYGVNSPPPALYLVVDGQVKISRVKEDSEFAIKLCQPEEFFGFGVFSHRGGEQAEATRATRLMHWPTPMLEDLLERQPHLAVVLVQEMTSRYFELGNRLFSLAHEPVAKRVATTLLSLTGTNDDQRVEFSGSTRLPHMPHKLLAQYVGTSREIITHTLNRFRRNGLIDYSRQEMVINRAALTNYLE